MDKIFKEEVHTIAAPSTIGPYSQGIRVGNLVCLSGQLPIQPNTGKLIEGGIEEQTLQAFINLEALAQATYATASDFLKLTIYLVNLHDFAVVNKVMEKVLRPPYPARSTVGVAALPKEALIEIDAMLWVPARQI